MAVHSASRTLRMSRPTRRSGSSFLTFRKRIPADLRDRARGRPVLIRFPAHGSEPECTVAATLGASEVTFSLRTGDPHVAKARTGIAEAHLQRLFASLRTAPTRLTHKQVIALAGAWYREFVEKLEDDPGKPFVFERLLEGVGERLDDPAKLRVEMASSADDVLATHALVVDEDSRERLMVAMRDAIRDAAGTLRRRAEGDYGPDRVVERFPSVEALPVPNGGEASPQGDIPSLAPLHSHNGGLPPQRQLKAVTFKALLAGWWREGEAAGLSRKTHQAYSSAMDRLAEHVGHCDASCITAEDIIGLKNARLAAGVSTKTVKDSDLAGLKAVFGWGVANRMLPANPVEGITVKRVKAVKLREKGFTDQEALALLNAACCHQRGQERPKTFAAKRWVPWLCAYTGARVGEIAQLRKQDIRRESLASGGEGDVWVITITPEAGAVKNKEAREVPLHPHLVEMGFPDFVARSADGHLFLTPGPGKLAGGKSGDVLGPLQGVKNRLAEFARDVVSDANVAPNHGWRHRFKTVGMDVGVSERVLDAICGHAPRTVGATYGTVTLTAKAAAVRAMPRYAVEE
ncbi:DUF6538 domain-containing protein [Xanthobacter sp. V2C-8]|uniref:DUF6538 domain-containing protein n=1 Tax=Xanthobacter albus TaxID=3119929 RepID=UPI0037281D9B